MQYLLYLDMGQRPISLHVRPVLCRCNMAITDGRVLNEALRDADGEPDLVPQMFSKRRHKIVQSYQQLEAVGENQLCNLSCGVLGVCF